MKCLSGGKVAFIYYDLVALTFTVRQYVRLQVPSEVSHADFWHRYFYKLYQLDQDEARKAALMKRADVVQEQLDLEWEDGEFSSKTLNICIFFSLRINI